MNKLFKSLLASSLALGLTACGSSSSTDNQRVGIIQLVQHPALDASNEGFKDALEQADIEVVYDDQNAQGDIANCDSIASKFVNDGVDLIYAIATPAAQSAASKTTDIPIVVSAVTDPQSSGLVQSNDNPGTNVTGASDLTPVQEQIDLLQQLMPTAKTVGVMYNSSEDNSIFQAELAKAAIEAAGMTYQPYTVSESNAIQQVVESAVGKVDAIYIPTDNLLADGMQTVAMVCNENNIPTIVGEAGMVSNGGLATYGIDYYELGKLAGLQAVEILKNNANPASMPIAYLNKEECELTINQTTADTLGITIPDELSSQAVIVE